MSNNPENKLLYEFDINGHTVVKYKSTDNTQPDVEKDPNAKMGVNNDQPY